MKSVLKICAWVFLIAFVLPAGASALWWSTVDRPSSWHQARWDASGVLPDAHRSPEAAIYIMSARTGGLKGAFSMHSWLVLKEAGSPFYQRFDKVGWGQPVRMNAYAADAHWYSNKPRIIHAVYGVNATRLIPQLRHAINRYPYNGYGEYKIWPGPNSNSFVAYVLRKVPELNTVLPALAVGRDFLGHRTILHLAPDWRDLQINLWGWIGAAVGVRSGLELQILGLVAGVDFRAPALKLPGIGRIGSEHFDGI